MKEIVRLCVMFIIRSQTFPQGKWLSDVVLTHMEVDGTLTNLLFKDEVGGSVMDQEDVEIALENSPKERSLIYLRTDISTLKVNAKEGMRLEEGVSGRRELGSMDYMIARGCSPSVVVTHVYSLSLSLFHHCLIIA